MLKGFWAHHQIFDAVIGADNKPSSAQALRSYSRVHRLALRSYSEVHRLALRSYSGVHRIALRSYSRVHRLALRSYSRVHRHYAVTHMINS